MRIREWGLSDEARIGLCKGPTSARSVEHIKAGRTLCGTVQESVTESDVTWPTERFVGGGTTGGVPVVLAWRMAELAPSRAGRIDRPHSKAVGRPSCKTAVGESRSWDARSVRFQSLR
jgi:hypothetical protein